MTSRMYMPWAALPSPTPPRRSKREGSNLGVNGHSVTPSERDAYIKLREFLPFWG